MTTEIRDAVGRAVKRFYRNYHWADRSVTEDDLMQEAEILLIKYQNKVEAAGYHPGFVYRLVYRGLQGVHQAPVIGQRLKENSLDLVNSVISDVVELVPDEEQILQARQNIRRALGRIIQDRYVDMLCDYHLRDYTAREIAEKYGWSLRAAKTYIHRYTDIFRTRTRNRTPGSATKGRGMIATTLYKVGDRVVILVPENERVHGTEGVIKEVKQEPDFNEPYYLLTAPAAATGEFRVLAEEMKPVPPVKPMKTTKKKINPKEMGYTGDVCSHCQGSRVTRNGACLKCEDCGESSGCS